MRYGVLGPLVVWGDEGDPVRVPEARTRALLVALLVHEGRAVSADRLIDDLWGEALPAKPANALQARVSQLRRAIGRNRVIHQPPGYRLHLEADDETDAARFQDLATRARSAAEARERAALLTEALELWRGPAYADFADEEFARTAAQLLTEQRLAVLEEQAEARLEAGDHTLLTGELADLVARHPLRERLRAVQLRALYRAGRQSEALASYAELRDHLAEEMGLDPSPELAALHQAILRQDADLAGPPPPAPAAPRTTALPALPSLPSLPAALTPLLGRDADLDQLARHLDGGARLVTLTGIGGVGKTSTALETARRLVRADGVQLVELAAERGDAADPAQLVAAAFGIREDTPAGQGPAPGEGGGDHLAAALRDRRALLVLDNCEHVIEPVAALVGRLLRAAPGLQILATSREPLGLAGEILHPLEPLPPSDAVRLFAERAAASAPGFALDESTREPVAEICRRLDGIPLALELAATRVRALGVRELAARLENRFRVLTSGQRGAPARQRTLAAMIDWSWELLSAPERIVLRRLAVPRDGCDLDAAEAVCTGEGVAEDEVLDVVTRLVDRSLVVMAEGPTGPRYRLLESVAAYAMDRLHEMADVADVTARHLHHYLALAERAAPRLGGADQRDWLIRLDTEAPNLRAAMESAGPDEAVRLARALVPWWVLRGRLTEGRRALEALRALAPEDPELRVVHASFALLTGDPAAPEPPLDSVTDGRVLWLYAYGLFNGGDPDTSEKVNGQALTLFSAADDRWGTAAALALRAMHGLIRGDLPGIARDAQDSARLFRRLGDRWGELQALCPLAALLQIKGDYAEAARHLQEGLRLAEELDLATEVAGRTSELGRLALLSQDWDHARQLHDTARALSAEQGYVYGEVHAVMGLALGARRAGDLDEAESYLARLRDDYPSSAAGDHLVLSELGFVAELRGDAARAESLHGASLRIADSLAEPRARALSWEGLAGAAALAGRADEAATLLAEADAARRSVGAPLPDAERIDVDRITAAIATARTR